MIREIHRTDSPRGVIASYMAILHCRTDGDLADELTNLCEALMQLLAANHWDISADISIWCCISTLSTDPEGPPTSPLYRIDVTILRSGASHLLERHFIAATVRLIHGSQLALSLPHRPQFLQELLAGCIRALRDTLVVSRGHAPVPIIASTHIWIYGEAIKGVSFDEAGNSQTGPLALPEPEHNFIDFSAATRQ